jgi:predicted transcriptional regulator
MGIIANFEALNNADLSKLQSKVDGIIAKINAALATQGKGKTVSTATMDEIKKAVQDSNLTVDDFISALEASKRATQ